MKAPSLRFFALASLLACGVFFSGCNKAERDQASAKVKSTYEDSKAAMSRAWTNVKDYTYEKRAEFGAKARELNATMKVQAAELRANYSEARASASRKAAMEEFRNAEADYKEKLRALGTATADTWDAAKQNAILAWERLEAAYRKARAD